MIASRRYALYRLSPLVTSSTRSQFNLADRVQRVVRGIVRVQRLFKAAPPQRQVSHLPFDHPKPPPAERLRAAAQAARAQLLRVGVDVQRRGHFPPHSPASTSSTAAPRPSAMVRRRSARTGAGSRGPPLERVQQGDARDQVSPAGRSALVRAEHMQERVLLAADLRTVRACPFVSQGMVVPGANIGLRVVLALRVG